MSRYCIDAMRAVWSIAILSEPVDLSVSVGTYASFSAAVKSPDPSFQWFDSRGRPVPLGNSNSLSFSPVKPADFGFYRLEILNKLTEEKTLTRWVELKNPLFPIILLKSYKPILDSSSQGGYYRRGSTFTLTAHLRNASGYQWYKDGEILGGCNGNNLTISNANLSNDGMYVLAATNYPLSGLMELTEAMRVKIC